MALFDPSVDTVDDVLEIRTRAIALLKEGASTISWNSEGTGVTKQIVMPISMVLQETLEFLRDADPTLYGKNIKRTVPRYTS